MEVFFLLWLGHTSKLRARFNLFPLVAKLAPAVVCVCVLFCGFVGHHVMFFISVVKRGSLFSQWGAISVPMLSHTHEPG